MKKLIRTNLILIVLFVTQSCKKNTVEKITYQPEHKKETSVVKNYSEIQTVKNFLNWYKIKYILSFLFITNHKLSQTDCKWF